MNLSPKSVHVQVTAWHAGHVLGAAMFMVEIAGLRVLYTGDYSRLADRHMSAADLPDQQPHIGAQAMLECVPRQSLGSTRLSCWPPICPTSNRMLWPSHASPTMSWVPLGSHVIGCRWENPQHAPSCQASD